jgi:hypothetical protein
MWELGFFLASLAAAAAAALVTCIRSSVSDPDSIRSVDTYPDPDPGGQK